MRILSVVGDRPGVLRLAPLAWALARRAEVEHRIVHTGRGDDTRGAGPLFADLALPPPHRHCEVGPGTPAAETAGVMLALEPILREWRPDVTLVYSADNATVAAALSAARLACAVAHLDAGLRSGDWSSPDEINRAVTDRVAALLLAPSRDALEQLALEGASDERVHFVGSVLIDSLCWALAQPGAAGAPARLGVGAGAYAVATLDQPAHLEDPAVLGELLAVLERVAPRMTVVFPVAPAVRERVAALGYRPLRQGGLRLLEPPGFVDLTALVAGAEVVVTDSGELQEETTFLGVPCVTVGSRTERLVTQLQGTNRLVQPRRDPLLAAVERALARRSPARPVIERWDGHAAERIVHVICDGERVDDLVLRERAVRHAVAVPQPEGVV